MSIGSLNLTPQEKFVEKLEAGLEKSRGVGSLVPPTPSPKLSPKFKAKSVERTKVQRKPGTLRPVNQSSRPVKSPNPVNPTGQSIDPTNSVNPSDQPVPSTSQLMGAVVKRPLAFYIPESINEQIEEALRYYQRKHHKKIDRSAIVSALLGDSSIWGKSALDKLAGKVIDQLKNRLNDRLTNQLTRSTS